MKRCPGQVNFTDAQVTWHAYSPDGKLPYAKYTIKLKQKLGGHTFLPQASKFLMFTVQR